MDNLRADIECEGSDYDEKELENLLFSQNADILQAA